MPYLDVAAGGVEIDPIKLYELYVQTVKELLSSKILLLKSACEMFSGRRGWVGKSSEISLMDTKSAQNHPVEYV